MHRKLLLVLSAVVLAGCAAPGPYRVTNFFLDQNSLKDIREKRVAVLPFKNVSGDFLAGEKATEEFNLQLGKTGCFTLVERLRIQEIFKEQDFDPVRIDESTAVSIGRMLGAHGVVLGTLSEYRPGTVGISVRLVSVEKGSQVWQAKDTFKSSDPRIQALVDSADRQKLNNDPEFLLQVLCAELARTIPQSK